MNNPIIDEVRAARAALAEEHGYDREKILKWARRKQAALESQGLSMAPHSGDDSPRLNEADGSPEMSQSSTSGNGQR